MKVWKLRMAVAGCAVLAGAILVSGIDEAQARPQYRTQFQKQYPKVVEKLAEKNEKITCFVCHEAKDAAADKPDPKKRNNYGDALMKVVEKNEKKTENIEAALKKVEPEKSAIKDKTFGDLLEEGKLPASKEE
ncbi:MAG: hypothetical protein KY476_24865 [Planctomycetes bacterium]|nr:hypothetical protein [Planctomycetota bacterium]